MSPWEENLKKRKIPVWTDALIPAKKEQTNRLLFQSPHDLGVIRNGGKRGAAHGPSALLAPLSKMVCQAQSVGTATHHGDYPLSEFETFQKEESDFFFSLLHDQNDQRPRKIAHLGGGHDHIYPLLNAFLSKYEKEEVVVPNIDAHLDTRTDDEFHSGTPFRQLSQKFTERMELIQVGIHSFANDPKNYREIPGMTVLPWEERENWSSEITTLLNLKKDKTLVLSLDCDGLDASYMKAVSAPNHRGLTQNEFWHLFEQCLSFWKESQKPALYGIYEFNPIFDDLGGTGARLIASSLFDFFESFE